MVKSAPRHLLSHKGFMLLGTEESVNLECRGQTGSITMIIWWGTRVVESKLWQGSFRCPTCCTSQPCTLIQLRKVATLYSFIPLGSGDEIVRYLECATCGAQQEATGYVVPAAGAVANVATWDCPKCANANPNHSYQCMKCRYSVV